MNILVRPLQEADLPLADRIFRLAFGTFNGLPDPLQFGGDLDKIRTRWLADPGAAFGAEVDGELVGSNFVTHWGSVGYFGPLTVHPDFWDRGVGQKLLEPALALFETWGCRHTGLYTYSQQPQAPGALPEIRLLAPVRSRPSCQRRSGRWRGEGRSAIIPRRRSLSAPGWWPPQPGSPTPFMPGWTCAGRFTPSRTRTWAIPCLVWDDAGLAGFAVVHCGPGSEAGSGAGFIKFGAARPGPRAEGGF